jgi:hypothetical protein
MKGLAHDGFQRVGSNPSYFEGPLNWRERSDPREKANEPRICRYLCPQRADDEFKGLILGERRRKCVVSVHANPLPRPSFELGIVCNLLYPAVPSPVSHLNQ